MALENNLLEKIKFAQASLFLMDSRSKVIGQATRLVIGTKSIPELSTGGTNVFNFVITSAKPFSNTNLTARIQFDRVVLENGQMVDIPTQVKMHEIKVK